MQIINARISRSWLRELFHGISFYPINLPPGGLMKFPSPSYRIEQRAQRVCDPPPIFDLLLRARVLIRNFRIKNRLFVIRFE